MIEKESAGLVSESWMRIVLLLKNLTPIFKIRKYHRHVIAMIMW